MEQVHVGIDISMATFNAAYQDDKGHWREAEFLNTTSGYRKLLAFVAEKSAVFTMEATGYYHLETALYLHGKGHRVQVVNPMLVKRFSQMRLQRGKTDRADARMIADFSKFNAKTLRDWVPLEGSMGEARGLITAIKQVTKQILQTCNAMHALRLTEVGRKAADRLEPMLQEQKRTQEELERRLLEIVQEEHGEMFRLIIEVPGVGEKTASALIVCTQAFAGFTNKRQLCAYVGLSPRVFESGSSVKGKGRICKLGNPYLRRLLYMCAVSSLRSNGPCKAFYESLVQRGKNKRQAIVAIANKLLRIVFAIAKSGKPWNPELVKA